MIGEQMQSLRYSKKECFEAANILVVLEIRELISKELKQSTYKRLSILSRQIQSYSDSLDKVKSHRT